MKKQFDLGLHCLSRPLGQATNFQNFYRILATLGAIGLISDMSHIIGTAWSVVSN